MCFIHCVGLQRSVAKFFIFFLTLALTTTAGAALAFTFSAMVSVFAVANLFVALVFILYMVSEWSVTNAHVMYQLNNTCALIYDE